MIYWRKEKTRMQRSVFFISHRCCCRQIWGCLSKFSSTFYFFFNFFFLFFCVSFAPQEFFASRVDLYVDDAHTGRRTTMTFLNVINWSHIICLQPGGRSNNNNIQECQVPHTIHITLRARFHIQSLDFFVCVCSFHACVVHFLCRIIVVVVAAADAVDVSTPSRDSAVSPVYIKWLYVRTTVGLRARWMMNETKSEREITRNAVPKKRQSKGLILPTTTTTRAFFPFIFRLCQSTTTFW